MKISDQTLKMISQLSPNMRGKVDKVIRTHVAACMRTGSPIENLDRLFIEAVEIVKLEDDIYYGNIVAEADGREIHIDSRSSDAIAIAARAHVPILVHPNVMEKAAVEPDQDLPESSAPPKKAPAPPLSDDGSDRLSVFKDFIEKLDIDDPNKDNPDSPPNQN